MGTDERERLFGQPSKLLAQEAVWISREEHGTWPTWLQAVESLAAFPSVDSQNEAEERLAQAICNGEIVTRLRERGRGHSFTFEVTGETADRIARRGIAVRTRPVPDEEEAC